MPSVKVLEQKKAIVEGLSEKFGRAASGVLVKYQGITVEDDTKLRAQVRANGDEYKIIDDLKVLEFFKENSGKSDEEFVSAICKRVIWSKLWKNI